MENFKMGVRGVDFEKLCIFYLSDLILKMKLKLLLMLRMCLEF